MKWTVVKKGNKYHRRIKLETSDWIMLLIMVFIMTVVLCNVL
jgi:hypothetical protein